MHRGDAAALHHWGFTACSPHRRAFQHAQHINQLLQQLAKSEGVDLTDSTVASGSQVPCKAVAKQEELKRLLRIYILAARVVLKNKGCIHFEWPQSCSGCHLEELQSFITEARLYLAVCHAFAFGSPRKKPWRIATSCDRLADALNTKRYVHDKSHQHVPVAGEFTASSARYPLQMCSFVMARVP